WRAPATENRAGPRPGRRGRQRWLSRPGRRRSPRGAAAAGSPERKERAPRLWALRAASRPWAADFRRSHCRPPAARTAAAAATLQPAWGNGSVYLTARTAIVSQSHGSPLRKGIAVSEVSPEIVKEFAPSGKLRAAI